MLGGLFQSPKEKVTARAHICPWCYLYHPYLSTVTTLLWLKAGLLTLSFSVSLHFLFPQAFFVVFVLNFSALYPPPIKQQASPAFPSWGKGIDSHHNRRAP